MPAEYAASLAEVDEEEFVLVCLGFVPLATWSSSLGEEYVELLGLVAWFAVDFVDAVGFDGCSELSLFNAAFAGGVDWSGLDEDGL